MIKATSVTFSPLLSPRLLISIQITENRRENVFVCILLGVLLLIFRFRFLPFVELCPRQYRNNPKTNGWCWMSRERHRSAYVSHTGWFNAVQLWSIAFVRSQKNVTTKWTNEAVQCIGVHIHGKTIGQILKPRGKVAADEAEEKLLSTDFHRDRHTVIVFVLFRFVTSDG